MSPATIEATINTLNQAMAADRPTVSTSCCTDPRCNCQAGQR